MREELAKQETAVFSFRISASTRVSKLQAECQQTVGVVPFADDAGVCVCEKQCARARWLRAFRQDIKQVIKARRKSKNLGLLASFVGIWFDGHEQKSISSTLPDINPFRKEACDGCTAFA